MTYRQAMQLMDAIYDTYSKMHSRYLYPEIVEINRELAWELQMAISNNGLWHIYQVGPSSDPTVPSPETIWGLSLIKSSSPGVKVLGEHGACWEVPFTIENEDEN